MEKVTRRSFLKFTAASAGGGGLLLTAGLGPAEGATDFPLHKKVGEATAFVHGLHYRRRRAGLQCCGFPPFPCTLNTLWKSHCTGVSHRQTDSTKESVLQPRSNG